MHETCELDRKGGMIVITEEKIDVFSQTLKGYEKISSLMEQFQQLEESSLLTMGYNGVPANQEQDGGHKASEIADNPPSRK